jgi:hypothetical protein
MYENSIEKMPQLPSVHQIGFGVLTLMLHNRGKARDNPSDNPSDNWRQSQQK